MAKKKATEVNEEPKVMEQAEAGSQQAAGSVQHNEELFPIEELFKMKFVGPKGEILMIRRAFRPLGKLETYSPRN